MKENDYSAKLIGASLTKVFNQHGKNLYISKCQGVVQKRVSLRETVQIKAIEISKKA